MAAPSIANTWTYESGGAVTNPSLTIGTLADNSELLVFLGKDDDVLTTAYDSDLTLVGSNVATAQIALEIYHTHYFTNYSLALNNPQQTAWNVNFGGNMRAFEMASNGSAFYMLDGVLDLVKAYTMSTPYDATTGAFSAQKTLTGLDGATSIRGVTFSDDGTKMYVNDVYFIYQYSLSTPFSIATLSYVNKKDLTGFALMYGELKISSDGSRIFVGTATGVKSFQLTSSYDITTLSTASEIQIAGSNIYGITLSLDGHHLAFCNGSELVYSYRLTTAWDLSSAYQVGSAVNIAAIEVSTGLSFNDSGSKLYHWGAVYGSHEYIIAGNQRTVLDWVGDSEEYVIQAHNIIDANPTSLLLETIQSGVTANPTSRSVSITNPPMLVIAGFIADQTNTPYAVDTGIGEQGNTEIGTLASTTGAGSASMYSVYKVHTVSGTRLATWFTMAASNDWNGFSISFQEGTKPPVQGSLSITGTSTFALDITNTSVIGQLSISADSSIAIDFRNILVTGQLSLSATSSIALPFYTERFGKIRYSAESVFKADSLPASSFHTVITQIQDEDGSETSPMLVGAPNIPLVLDVHSIAEQYYYWRTTDETIFIKPRWLIRNTTGSAVSFNPKLQVRKNGAAWQDITTYQGYINHTFLSFYQGKPVGTLTGKGVGYVDTGDLTYDDVVFLSVLEESNGDKLLLVLHPGSDLSYHRTLSLFRWSKSTGTVSTVKLHMAIFNTTTVWPSIEIIYGGGSIDKTSAGVIYMAFHGDGDELGFHSWNGSTLTEYTSDIAVIDIGWWMIPFIIFIHSDEVYLFGRENNSLTYRMYKWNGSNFGSNVWTQSISTGEYPVSTLFYDGANNRVLFLSSTAGFSQTVKKYEFNLTSKTWSVTTWGTADVATVFQDGVQITRAVDKVNSNLMHGLLGKKTPSSGLNFITALTLDTSTGVFTQSSVELVYKATTTFPVCYMDNVRNLMWVIGLEVGFEKDVATGNMVAALGYNYPTNIYGDTLSTWWTNRSFKITPDGDNQPDYFFFRLVPGIYPNISVYLDSQDLEHPYLHGSDTTKQLPSSNTYTYVTNNNAYLTHYPYPEGALTLLNGEEAEFVVSLHVNRTQLEAIGATTTLEYRLLNQAAGELNDRGHYPTVIYSVYNEVLGEISATADSSFSVSLSPITGNNLALSINADSSIRIVEATFSISGQIALTADATVDVVGKYVHASAMTIVGDSSFSIYPVMTLKGAFSYNAKAYIGITADITRGGIIGIIPTSTMAIEGRKIRHGAMQILSESSASIKGNFLRKAFIDLIANSQIILATSLEIPAKISINSVATADVTGNRLIDAAISALAESSFNLIYDYEALGRIDFAVDSIFTLSHDLTVGAKEAILGESDTAINSSIEHSGSLSITTGSGMDVVFSFDDNRDTHFLQLDINREISGVI